MPQGRTVNFRSTAVIMTSNIGSLYLLDGVTDDGEIREDTRERVMGELRSHFRPEFLNRVDEIVLFKPLTLGEIEQIVDLQVDDVKARLAGRRLGTQADRGGACPDRAPGLRPGVRSPAAAPLHPARGRDQDRTGADRGRDPRRHDHYRRRERRRAGGPLGRGRGERGELSSASPCRREGSPVWHPSAVR